jgi:hypothetical protein
LTPNADRNQAPETWITAAPQDTVTVRDPQGRVDPGGPPITTIPVRFHVYWAGADRDGQVVGYYWAVVETLAVPPPGGFVPPNLPGPKPQDYHYTTKTDSFFIFNVSEEAPDRRHAFFIYAVDEKGRPDATPARFIFNAIDRYPPIPIITEAKATGTIYRLVGGNIVPEVREYFFTDRADPTTLPSDTIPSNSRIDLQWIAQIQIAGSYVVSYKYKLDEPTFVEVDSSVHSVSYNTGLPGSVPIAPGVKVFTLRAIDQAGGKGETTRRAKMNFSPDSWWSGPDTLSPVFTSNHEGRFLTVPNFGTFGGISGTLMSPDSVTVMPAFRPRRKSFFEIYGNRIFARAEFDTVHLNSWVVLHNGGYDQDSRYRVEVDPADPAIPLVDGQIPIVLRPDVENGSPIGFRTRVQTRIDPFGTLTQPAQTGLHPVFQPASVFRVTRMAGYWAMIFSGKAYAVGRSEDGDGDLDLEVSNADMAALADRVDAGGGTARDRELRDRVLVFYVNKRPYLSKHLGAFRPQPNEIYTRTATNDGLLTCNLIATDIDPYNRNSANRSPGGPVPPEIFQYAVEVLGRNAAGEDTTYRYLPNPTQPTQFFFTTPSINFTIPRYIVAGAATVRITLCDCQSCGADQGSGLCITDDIPIQIVETLSESQSSLLNVRPGTSSGGRNP